MQTQKHLFQLPDNIHYLNCAYMSPLLKSVEEAGIAGLQRKRNPAVIKPADFFNEAEIFRTLAGRLVNGHPQQIAVTPSASYGLAAAVNNLPLNNGHTAIVVTDEFPSGYNTVKKWCTKHGKSLQVITAPDTASARGEQWNDRLLDAINDETAVVLVSSVHWTDGTRFDLKAIGDACRRRHASFIVDGTQSVGAVPIDVQACGIDALACAGYKWLLGPYATGFTYFSEQFNGGEPLEESWMNRTNANNFSALVSYCDDYTPGAGRYNMGQFSNFALLPMMNAALEQLLEWQPERIAAYCAQLSLPLVDFLREHGFAVENDAYRSPHMFGFGLPAAIDRAELLAALERNHVVVSVRGKAIRVSMHLFNTVEDVAALMAVLDSLC